MKNIKIILASLVLILLSGAGVMAMTTQRENIKIIMANGYEMTVPTSKTKVADILSENNIYIEEDKKVTPDLEEEIKAGEAITITNKSAQEIQIAKVSEEGVKASLDELLQSYAPIVEKRWTEQVAIPFETITKNAAEDSEDTKNKVVQQGEDGIKEVTYKAKFQNDIEIENTRTTESEVTIKEPVDKIVQVQQVVTSRASTASRTAIATEEENTSTEETSGKSIGVYKITGYCSCAKCCGSATGRTASGTVATAGRTVAASSALPFGTQLNINGHTYTVEDRGGAIKGNKIDIFFSSHSQALAWGVKYLPVEILD